MNDTEKERILRLVSEGILRPQEAASLLAALSEEPTPAPPQPAAKPVEEKTQAEPPKQQNVQVQMQRADGTYYTVELPPNLVPMFVKMAGVMIKESVRTAAHETWDGLKTIARNKTHEVKENVKQRIGGSGKAEEKPAQPAKPQPDSQAEARHQIIQMVQNGRLSAADAARLIEQLDALQQYRQTAAPAPAGKSA